MATPVNDWLTYSDQIKLLESLEFNYDDKTYHDSVDKLGWFVDKYDAILAVEPQGPPLVNGPFEVVKDAIGRYQFPDPDLIRAWFDPNIELAKRNMLMQAQFIGFKFYFGVRVTSVIDEEVPSAGGTEKRWGYSYRTLKGHFEIGEIRFIVSKNLTSGEVTFHVDAYSKPDRIPNLFYRVGFKIFGRSLQNYFARSSIERLKAIAQASLENLKTAQQN